MSKKLLSSVSAPAVSKTFTRPNAANPATILMRNDAAPGTLTAGDVATVQMSVDDGISWVDLIKDGTLVQLTEENNHESIYGPGMFRLNLTAVTGPVSAYLVRG